MTTGNREDYLINILRLTEDRPIAKTTELASLMGVSAASVSEMLKTLSKEGLVSYQKYKGVSLTETGMEQARHLRRKHHIMEKFLIDVLEKDEMLAHDEACKMEHVISDESAHRMCKMIGYEPCDECAETCDSRGSGPITLTQLKPSTQARISHIKCDDPNQVRKLISMGFAPGRPVRADKSPPKGPVIVRVGDSSVAMDTALTDMIYVEVE